MDAVDAELGDGMTERTWGLWTEQKLDLLSNYLERFTTASLNKASGTTIYLDLFAGAAANKSRSTGDDIDGSPRRALKVTPEFSRVVLFEMPNIAAPLEHPFCRILPVEISASIPGTVTTRSTRH